MLEISSSFYLLRLLSNLIHLLFSFHPLTHTYLYYLHGLAGSLSFFLPLPFFSLSLSRAS